MGGQSPNDWGIIPRAIEHIFAKIAKSSGQHEVKMTFVELYNDRFIDLLDLSKSDKQIDKIIIKGGEKETVYLFGSASLRTP